MILTVHMVHHISEYNVIYISWLVNSDLLMQIDSGSLHYVHYTLFCVSDQIGEQLENLIEQMKKALSGSALQFYEREFDFFHKITDISRLIK